MHVTERVMTLRLEGSNRSRTSSVLVRAGGSDTLCSLTNPTGLLASPWLSPALACSRLSSIPVALSLPVPVPAILRRLTPYRPTCRLPRRRQLQRSVPRCRAFPKERNFAQNQSTLFLRQVLLLEILEVGGITIASDFEPDWSEGSAEGSVGVAIIEPMRVSDVNFATSSSYSEGRY
jgi:hypothetical protein